MPAIVTDSLPEDQSSAWMAFPYVIAAGPVSVKTQKSAFPAANRRKNKNVIFFLLLTVPTFSKYTAFQSCITK